MDDYGLRLVRGLRRTVADNSMRLSAARLPSLNSVLADIRIRFDRAQLPSAAQLLDPERTRLARLHVPHPGQRIATARAKLEAQRLPSPDRPLSIRRDALDRSLERLGSAGRQRLTTLASRLDAARLNVAPLRGRTRDAGRELAASTERLAKAGRARLQRDRSRLERAALLLDALSYQGVLARGYALVTDTDGSVVRSAQQPVPGQPVTLTFSDGTRQAVIDGATTRKRAAKPKARSSDSPQQTLF